MPVTQDRILAILSAAEFYQELTEIMLSELRRALRTQTTGGTPEEVGEIALYALFNAEPRLVHAGPAITAIATERQHYKDTNKHNNYMREYQRSRRLGGRTRQSPAPIAVSTTTITPSISSEATIAAAIARGDVSTNGKRYQPLDSQTLAKANRLLASETGKDASELMPAANPKDILNILGADPK